MATKEELQTRLAEAEKVYHEWSTGQTVRSYRDQNGESVDYSQQGMNRLYSYIVLLRSQITDHGKTITSYRGPLRFTFGRGDGYY